jgi:beta-phosphoglucomutase
MERTTGMPTPGTHGVIWDLDGVIIDSAEQHWHAWQVLAAETHMRFTLSDFRTTFGLRNADIIPRFWHTDDPDEIARLASRKEEIFRSLMAQSAHALPGSLELMRALHDAGWLQALGSSAPMENIRQIMGMLHLDELLDAVVSGEEAPQGKPAPDVFLAAARALGLSPIKCLVVEDAVAGVQAAHAAGMRCVAVTNGRPNRALDIADLVVPALTALDVARLASLVG